MTATIPTYNQANSNFWTPTGQQTVQLAMVGMHVVGSTAGHPEMVWATFEHVNNTPAATYSYNSTSGPQTVSPTPSGTWLFLSTGSPGSPNIAHMFFTGPPSNNIQSNGAFTISPSDTLRSEPWGIDGSNAFSNTEVISMNEHVRGMMASGDMRGNYIMTGATWTPFWVPSLRLNSWGRHQPLDQHHDGDVPARHHELLQLPPELFTSQRFKSRWTEPHLRRAPATTLGQPEKRKEKSLMPGQTSFYFTLFKKLQVVDHAQDGTLHGATGGGGTGFDLTDPDAPKGVFSAAPGVLAPGDTSPADSPLWAVLNSKVAGKSRLFTGDNRGRPKGGIGPMADDAAGNYRLLGLTSK